jgi:molybdopterin-guanine dinucleotide biosynthesis protein A
VNTNLKSSLETYLAQGERKVRKWFEQHKTNYVDFGENASGFENINTIVELQ